MKIGEVDPGSHFGKTLNCSPEAEESIGNYLLNQDAQVAVFWFPPDGEGWGLSAFSQLPDQGSLSALWYS